MAGWDAPLGGNLVLQRCASAPSDGGPAHADLVPATYRLDVRADHCNVVGALHGGCTASIIDALGSSVVAMGDPHESGALLPHPAPTDTTT